MVITKIEKLSNNRYKLIIDDDSIITYDNVILENNLLYKKNIDNTIYNKIIEDTCYYNIYNKCVKYILKKRRSEKEVREYLLKNNMNYKQIDEMIDKLKTISLINDIEYCKAFINDNIYLSKNGLNKIKDDLLKQNISIEVIEDCIKEIDINILDERLEKIIIKKIKSNKKYSNVYLKQKILNDMINLGYSKNKIIEILDNNIYENNNILEKEFNKVLNKLSKKYSNEELYKNIKLKLISKGFEIEKINRLIQEKTEE